MREIMPSALAPNSGYFIASGASHCTIPGNSLYSVEADGVRLIDNVEIGDLRSLAAE